MCDPFGPRDRASGMTGPSYASVTHDLTFYDIRKRDVYRRIVGNHRIRDFMSRDLQYHSAFPNDTLYCGIRKETSIAYSTYRTH